MPKKIPPQKRLEMAEIGSKYDELKRLRRVKRAEYDAQLEEDMEQARAEFGQYLQGKIERTGLPYKFNVSDLMTAMGTTDRKTVNDFLGGARDRMRNRFSNDEIVPFLGMQILDKKTWMGPFERRYYRAVVTDADGVVRIAQLAGVLNRYETWTLHGDESGTGMTDQTWSNETKLGKKEFKRPGTYPEWLTWLDNNTEWLEFLEES